MVFSVSFKIYNTKIGITVEYPCLACINLIKSHPVWIFSGTVKIVIKLSKTYILFIDENRKWYKAMGVFRVRYNVPQFVCSIHLVQAGL